MIDFTGKQAAILPLSQEMIDEACFVAKDKAWFAVADLFDRKRELKETNYQLLADRIDRKKSQVHRWVDSSSNMTLQSLGLLAAGLDAEVQIRLVPHSPSNYGSNYCHPSEAAAQVICLRVRSVSSENDAKKSVGGSYDSVVGKVTFCQEEEL